MYIHPFIAGMIVVLLVESIGLFIYGIVLQKREDDNGKKK